MLEPFVQQAIVMNLAYLAIATIAYGVGLHIMVLAVFGSYSKIMEKLDDNPLAIGVFLGLLAHAYAGLVGAILH